MTIQSMPQAATLTWEGLRNLPIPQEVRQGCVFNEIELSRKGIDELPAPLNRATCWIYCREAWPHSNPDFEGDIFITLAVQADHRYCQLVPGNKHTEIPVIPGLLFTTDPLSLHWLAPNSDDGAGFIGLQFEVPYHSADEFFSALTAELSSLGQIRVERPALNDALLVATGEYVGTPPGPLAEMENCA